MPSSYSPLKIQLMATGENNTSWGDVTNTNLGTALEEAIVGSTDVTFASANVTLTLTDTNATQPARNLRLRCTGTTGGATRNLVVPAIEKPYIVQNNCADSVLIKTPAGTGVTVPAGATMWVYNDGVNVTSAISYAPFLGAVDVAAVNGVIGALTSVNFTSTNVNATNAILTNMTAANVFTANVDATSAVFTNLNATTSILTNLTATNLNATTSVLTNLTATNLNATTSILTNLTATNATATNLNATTAILTDLTTTNATATNLNATTSILTNLTATNLNATTSILTNLTATNLNATTAILTNLTATDATSTNLTATTVLDAVTIGAAAPGFRGLPQNSQTAAYTLALSDAGKHISITTGGVIIPANSSIAFPVGTAIVIFNNSGATQSLSITTDTLRLAGTATTGTRTLTQYGLATCVKVASTTWVVSGTVS